MADEAPDTQEDQDEDEAGGGAAEGAAPPRRGKRIKWIALALVVGGGGGAAWFFLAGPGRAQAAPAEKAEAEDEAAPPAKGGPLVEMDPFIVNLNEPEGNRYLKTTISLQAMSGSDAEAMGKMKTPLRDAVLLHLSSLTYADTQGTERKEAIRAEIVRRANETLGSDRVARAYFTEFVSQ